MEEVPSVQTALYFDGVQASLRTDFPTVLPKEDEALVRVVRAGICATDLAIACGNYRPQFRGPLGHEFVGRIVMFGARPPSHLNVGARVVGEINATCGVSCAECTRTTSLDRAAFARGHCPLRRVLGIHGDIGGAFAQYLCLPVRNLISVPPSISDLEACFVEPLAAAFRVVEQIQNNLEIPGVRVAVIGDGKLGLLLARVLATKLTTLDVYGRHARNLETLRDLSHVVRTFLSHPALLEYDVVVEATGKPEALKFAIKAVRSCGVIVLKSTCSPTSGSCSLDVEDANELVVRELRLIGSRCGPFDTALSALAEKRVDVSSLFQYAFNLVDAEKALIQSNQPGVLKVHLVC